MARSKSSKAWLRRHVNDPYVHRAKAQGYRSRSAYKLIEIANRDKLVRPGDNVVDLGAAPGGWAQALGARHRGRSSGNCADTRGYDRLRGFWGRGGAQTGRGRLGGAKARPCSFGHGPQSERGERDRSGSQRPSVRAGAGICEEPSETGRRVSGQGISGDGLSGVPRRDARGLRRSRFAQARSLEGRFQRDVSIGEKAEERTLVRVPA